jgi:trehalose 6-phosphate synthase/phosphatase
METWGNGYGGVYHAGRLSSTLEVTDTATHRKDAADLVVASNRLPVRVTLEDGKVSTEPSSGGLAAALGGLEGSRTWVGWPGTAVPQELEARVSKRLARDGLYPVFLSPEEEDGFYGRICNDSIWPLFHYLPGRFGFSQEAWSRYVDVNERFAEAIAQRCRPGSRVWVHDFHLMLVPEALRRRRPDVAIGFFLHIPFPSSEIYRLLPSREQVLRGLLGADYISFHTGDYARHFRSSLLRVLGIDSEPDAVEHEGRLVGIGVDPVGIDVESFKQTLADPETAAVQAEIEDRYRGRRLILGVERLDYTKGIPQKLQAFEKLLEQRPELAEATTMLQVLVPSRLESPEYRGQRDEIELQVAHVNGRFGEPGRTPVEYVHRSISRAELAALYRRADVMAVTPIRDGMNLVAQEFVLCQSAEPDLPGRWRGALVLSELAGAAHVLPGALLVNPWDADDIEARFVEALELDADERRRRLGLMAGRVEQLDCRRWAGTFLSRLDRYARTGGVGTVGVPLDTAAEERIARRSARAAQRTLLLDYDGTLRELASHPDLATPTKEIVDLLADLAALPATDVHVVSGRRQDTLEQWFGDLPVYLCAEHGYLARVPGGRWERQFDVDLSWLPRIERLLRRVTSDVPGTLVERKSCSVTWHYRQAEPEYGAWRAREVLVAVEQLLHGAPAEILLGHRVIEVRARGVNKGAYVRGLFPAGKESSRFVLAAGDDRTDMDLYTALPAGSIGVHVGRLQQRARDVSLRDQLFADSPQAVRRLLRSLVDRAQAVPAAELV